MHCIETVVIYTETNAFHFMLEEGGVSMLCVGSVFTAISLVTYAMKLEMS